MNQPGSSHRLRWRRYSRPRLQRRVWRVACLLDRHPTRRWLSIRRG